MSSLLRSIFASSRSRLPLRGIEKGSIVALGCDRISGTGGTISSRIWNIRQFLASKEFMVSNCIRSYNQASGFFTYTLWIMINYYLLVIKQCSIMSTLLPRVIKFHGEFKGRIIVIKCSLLLANSILTVAL